jgi:plastocyanin
VRGITRFALALAAAGTCWATGSALAADQDVAARNLSFTPDEVALKPGETLTIRHDDGAIAHNLKFDDEPKRRVEASTGWVVKRTFTVASDQPYSFFCSLHAGMRGYVWVNDAGVVPQPTATPVPSRTPIPSATPTPTASASPSATPVATGEPPPVPPASAPAAAATLRSARILGARRRGLKLRIDLSAPAPVRVTLRRGARRIVVRFARVAAGPRTLRIHRRLKRGRYRLVLRAAGTTRTFAFRVR